jgi:hypothetical protein
VAVYSRSSIVWKGRWRRLGPAPARACRCFWIFARGRKHELARHSTAHPPTGRAVPATDRGFAPVKLVGGIHPPHPGQMQQGGGRGVPRAVGATLLLVGPRPWHFLLIGARGARTHSATHPPHTPRPPPPTETNNARPRRPRRHHGPPGLVLLPPPGGRGGGHGQRFCDGPAGPDLHGRVLGRGQARGRLPPPRHGDGPVRRPRARGLDARLADGRVRQRDVRGDRDRRAQR